MRASSRRPSGLIIVDGAEVGDTRKCPHCGLPFRHTRETAKKARFCTNCGQTTCGLPGCHECLPEERKVEMIERGVKVPGF